MKRIFSFTVTILSGLIFLVLNPSNAVSQTRSLDPVIISASGWIIKAYPEKEVLSLAHDSLGILLQEIRLNIKSKSGISQLSDWIIEKKDETRLSVQTKQPGSS